MVEAESAASLAAERQAAAEGVDRLSAELELARSKAREAQSLAKQTRGDAAEARSAGEDMSAALEAMRTKNGLLEHELGKAKSLCAQKDLMLMGVSKERVAQITGERDALAAELGQLRARLEQHVGCGTKSLARGS